jgi:hypothetical protein
MFILGRVIRIWNSVGQYIGNGYLTFWEGGRGWVKSQMSLFNFGPEGILNSDSGFVHCERYSALDSQFQRIFKKLCFKLSALFCSEISVIKISKGKRSCQRSSLLLWPLIGITLVRVSRSNVSAAGSPGNPFHTEPTVGLNARGGCDSQLFLSRLIGL